MQMQGVIAQISRCALTVHGRFGLGHQDMGFPLSEGFCTSVPAIPHNRSCEERVYKLHLIHNFAVEISLALRNISR